MKKLICIAIFFLLTVNTFAQFKLSGKINHYTGTAELKINIPVVYGFFDQNSIKIPVAKNGSFSITIPVKSQKFASLFFQASPHLLLLNANKNLTVELDETNKNIKIVSGTASPENSLLEKIKMDEYPFFLQNDSYTQLNYNALTTQVLKPYLASRDKKIGLVNQSAINPADKKLIAAETKYATYNYLYDLTDIGAGNPAELNKLVADVYNKASVKPDVLPGGPQYYLFVSNYLQNVEKNKADKGQSTKPNTFLSRWETAVKYLPAPVAEQFGYQLIIRAFYMNDATQGSALTTAYLKKFPSGTYASDVKKKAATFK
jgi:hypothetical protein